MSALTTFEKDVLQQVLQNECPQAIEDIALLTVTSRENTGVGAYIHFEYQCDILRKTSLPSHIGSSVAIKIQDLSGSAGCVLFFTDNKIALLEFFTYGSQWPEDITDYHIEMIR